MDFEHLRELGNDGKFNCLYGAPTLIIISGDEKSPVPLDADCAAATENLLLAAESIGWDPAGFSLYCLHLARHRALSCEESLRSQMDTGLILRLCLDTRKLQL